MSATEDEIIGEVVNPFQRTPLQQRTIAIIPRVTGSISFVSSATIIYMILQSEVKFASPFRRIIFAMCVVDLMQSGMAAISTLSSPKDTPGIWGAMGNDATCSATGFIFQFSSTAASLYMVSLMCHYFCFVQYKVSQSTFVRRIEPWLHAVPLLVSLLDAAFLLGKDHLNQADVVCWIASVPYNCINEDSIECIRGEHSYIYRWILAGIPNALALVGLNLFAYRIYRIVKQHHNGSTNEEDYDGGEEGDHVGQYLHKDVENVINHNEEEEEVDPQCRSSTKKSESSLLHRRSKETVLTKNSTAIIEINLVEEDGIQRPDNDCLPEQVIECDDGDLVPDLSIGSSVGNSAKGLTFLEKARDENDKEVDNKIVRTSVTMSNLPPSENDGDGSYLFVGKSFEDCDSLKNDHFECHFGDCHDVFPRKISRPSPSKENETYTMMLSTTPSGYKFSSNYDSNHSEDLHGNGKISGGVSLCQSMDDQRNIINKEGDDSSKTKLRARREERRKVYETKRKEKILGFRSKEAKKQSFLFTGSFLVCYIWVYLNATFEFIPGYESPYVVRLGLWFFFPLQGLFNIMVFIRPHVLALRVNEKGITLMEAIWKVVKSGADISTRKEAARKKTALRQRTKLVRTGDLNDNKPAYVPPESAFPLSLPMADIKKDTFDAPEAVSSMSFGSSHRDVDDLEDHYRMVSQTEQGGEEVPTLMYGDNDYDIYDDINGILSSYDGNESHFRHHNGDDDDISGIFSFCPIEEVQGEEEEIAS